MAEIETYLLGEQDEIAKGDDLRVRPWSPPAASYGHGRNPGPVLHGVGLQWEQPLTVVAGKSDPGEGTISLEVVERHREVFMSENSYQQFISETS